MKIALNDIPEQGLEWSASEKGSSFLLDEKGLSFISPVRITIRLFKEGREVFLTGEVTTEAELTCSRCLVNIRQALNIPLKLVYRPRSFRNDNSKELKKEDLLVSYYQGGVIDLQKDIQEALILALPAKVLCRRDCRGLCAHCGTNLNQKECPCSRSVKTNSSFSGLSNILQEKIKTNSKF